MLLWRERLRKQILSWERGGSLQHSTLNELNALMATHPMRTRIKTNGKKYLKELWFEPRVPEDLLAPLAQGSQFPVGRRSRCYLAEEPKADGCTHFYGWSVLQPNYPPRSASRTIVVQWTGRWRSCDAGDRAEIFVDGAQVMVCQVF